MYHQSIETREEEEDKARDQDLAESGRWAEHRSLAGRRSGSELQDSQSGDRVHSQRGLQGPLPQIHRL